MKASYSEFVGENSTDEDERYRQVDFLQEAVAVTSADTAAPTAASAAEFSGYSETNVQVLGVDEASPVKFDGEHLLVQSQTNYYTTRESNQGPRILNFPKQTLSGNTDENIALHFSPDPDYNYQGLLRNDDYAALVGYKTSWYPYSIATTDFAPSIYCYDCTITEPDLIVYTWRYSQDGIGLPPQIEEITIDGSFNSVRLIGTKLYLISQFSPSIDALEYYPLNAEDISNNQRIIDELELEDVSPQITIEEQSQDLVSSNCVIPEESDNYRRYPQVLSLTQIDIENPSDWQSACVIGDINGAFFSLENIYLSRWLWQDNETEILKFSASIQDGVSFEASGSVGGSVSYDSYYFGEVDGHLVYVNTLYDNELWWNFDGRHQLSVFEQNGTSLDLAAQIPNENNPSPIGKPGEQIYAVRIIDERAYIVTFDKVDPLYVIDLSEPTAPAILGELEIPGFSSYIHPINNDLLIGVGKNAETYEGTTWFQGLNIRLFDVSDPTQPIALQSLDYGYRGSDSPVSYDPHAFTFAYDEANQVFRFALPMRLHGNIETYDPEAHPNTYYATEESGLYQFEVSTGDTANISESGRYLFDENNLGYYSTRAHSVIDDNSIYLVRDETLDVLEWGGTTALRSFELSN